MNLNNDTDILFIETLMWFKSDPFGDLKHHKNKFAHQRIF